MSSTEYDRVPGDASELSEQTIFGPWTEADKLALRRLEGKRSTNLDIAQDDPSDHGEHEAVGYDPDEDCRDDIPLVQGGQGRPIVQKGPDLVTVIFWLGVAVGLIVAVAGYFGAYAFGFLR